MAVTLRGERTERIIFHAELGQYSSHQIATFAHEN